MIASAVFAMVMLVASPAGSDDVKHVTAKELQELLKKPPAKLMQGDNYQVMTMRRTEAGQAEWHEVDIDVIYVIDGSATLVTGGTMPEEKTTERGEKRAASITGGKTQTISKGDVLTVPAQVPHWFSGVNGSITYFVVKVQNEVLAMNRILKEHKAKKN